MNRLFIILLLSCFFSGVYAQRNMPDKGSKTTKEGGGVGLIRDKDTLKTYLKSWTLSESNFIVEIPVDTLIRSFEVFDPKSDNFFQGATSNTGNIGSPVFQNVFLTNIPDINSVYYTPLLNSTFSLRPVFLFQPVSQYISTMNNCRFYHTNKPFTNIFYAMNNVKAIEEQRLKFTHTQNLNKNTNIGLSYKLVSSEGMYASQRNTDNAFQVFGSYMTKRYNLHTSLGINKLQIGENGGIVGIEDPDIATTAVPVYLKSRSTLKQINYTLVQRINLGKKIVTIDSLAKSIADSLMVVNGDSIPAEVDEIVDYKPFSSIVHRFEINRGIYIYEDKTDSSAFYSNYYLPRPNGSIDSSRIFLITNSLEWLLPVNAERRFFPNSGIRAVAGHELEKYHYLKYYIAVNQNDNEFSNIYIGGNLFRQRGNLQIDASSKIYIAGRKIGNINLGGDMKGNIKIKNDSALISVAARFKVERPTFFEEKYYSTNFRWDNELNDIVELRIKGILAIPRWKIYGGIDYAAIDNYTYFGVDTVPKQLSTGLSVLSFFGEKDFHLSFFHSINKFVFQTSSNKEVIHLPQIIFYNSSFIELNLKVIKAQLGVDVTYSSRYKAPAYSPALGTFYLQNEFETGNYAVVDVFANFKLKNALLFFKYEHINSLLSDEKYFPVYKHPYNDAIFKIGVAWKFFN